VSRAGLGRGLAALLGDDPRESSFGSRPQDALLRLPVESIRPNPEQPRDHFEPAALADLSASIKAHGVLSPLVVRRDPTGAYVLVAGERRWRAAKMAGIGEVPAIVLGRTLSSAEQLELALIENLQREDLDPVEAALGYQRLIQHHGHTQDTVAKQVGKDRTTVTNALRLLRLPEAGLAALRERRISAGHARALLAVEDPEQFRVALATVLGKELSVRATEQLVRSLKRPAARMRAQDRGYARLGEQLTRQLGAKVTLKPRGRGGRIVIDYVDGDELARITGLFGA
jgi:ParB family transcriptional regulator, chromosome partitioning protein